MESDELFIKFCRDRNIKDSTMKGYRSSLLKYSLFTGCSLSQLINEANEDEYKRIPLKNRRIKKHLMDYRNYLFDSELSQTTIKTYFSKLITFYKHYEIEIPHLPNVQYEKEYETNYLDLPTKNHIKQALDICELPFKALILFMASSGTAKAETLSLSVDDFISACSEYYNSTTLEDILFDLSLRDDIVPTIYLKRIKTDKYYYTFCSTEASKYIIKYLRQRKNLKLKDRLFPFSGSLVMNKFQEINDKLEWGFKGKYRFFRTHTLRKFHASNIQLSSEYVDALQGRSKSKVHETYIKTNPSNLKKIYMENMKNILIYDELNEKKDTDEDIHITINVFLSDEQINLY